jgi:hypothetical protein
MAVDKARETIGEHLSSQVVQHLQLAKFERRSGVPQTQGTPPAADAAKVLKDLKDLLDSGIITEEEYKSRRMKYLQQL